MICSATPNAWTRLGDHLQETQLLGSIQSTLYWDQNTRMPSGGAAWRGQQLALLARQLHARQSSQRYADLIAEARAEWRANDGSIDAGDLKEQARNLDLLEQDLRRQQALDPSITQTITAPAPTKEAHSRKPKGECGQRNGRKLDQVLAQIRHEEHAESCESACCESPVAVLEKPPELSSVDPPAEANGATAERAPDDSAAGGSGFLNQATVWDVMSGQGSLLTDLRDFLGHLDQDPRLRASANLRTLSRVREHLERIPESAAMGDPVELRLQDVLVLMNQLMARMR